MAERCCARIDLDDPSTVATLAACAAAVDELASQGLIAMLEPFISSRVDGKVQRFDPDAVIKSIHISQGLGSTSAYVDEAARRRRDGAGDGGHHPADPVARRRPADPDEAFASWEKAWPALGTRIDHRPGGALSTDGDVGSAVANTVSMVR